jgi:hypothetical protein
MQLLNSSIDRITAMRSRPKVTIWDKNWENPMPLLGEIEASFEEILNDTGEGLLKLFGSNKLNEWLLDELDDEEDVHITVDSAGKRWSGKASTIEEEGTEDGKEYVTIRFVHEYEHVKKIVCYCNPLLPPEFQYPKIFAYAGPAAFGVKAMMFLNLLRRFGPLWALPEDIFDPLSWQEHLDPNQWPIVVMPGGLLDDTSMWCVLATRFGMLHDVVAPTLADAGLQITATRWLPGDAQPAPDHMTLDKPTLLLDVIDKSGYKGPTGTIFDGLLHLITEVADDLINEVVHEVAPGPNDPDYSLSGYMGTKPDRPWVSWRNAHRTGLSGISSWKRTVHKATAGAIVTGGHSPDWVNSGIKLLVNAALGYIGWIFGNPGLALGVFDSQVEDVVLAFHRVANPIRQAKMGVRGPGFGEVWESSGGTGFSLSALQAIRAGFWRSRAYVSYKFTVINGAPYWVGRHFDVGDRVSAEVGRKGELYIDHVHALKMSWSRTQDPRWTVSIGDDGAEDMPGAVLARQIEQVRGIANAIGVSS